ncbi:hypothetical protein J467_4497, partial [Acinetobacter baumannii 916567]
MRLMINKSMKNIYIMGLLLACSGFAMAETVTQQPTEQPVRTASNPNAIRIVTRPEIMSGLKKNASHLAMDDIR